MPLVLRFLFFRPLLFSPFPQLCVLDAGRCLYFGPTGQAADYFTGLGFTRPPTRSIPEMITTVSDPNFQEDLITPGCEDTVPRTVGDFVAAFAESSHCKDVQQALDEGVKGEFNPELSDDLNSKVHRRALQSPFRQFQILFSRSVRLIVAQPVTFVVTVLANVIFGLVLGSIFFNLDQTEAGAFSRVRCLHSFGFFLGAAVGPFVLGFSCASAMTCSLPQARRVVPLEWLANTQPGPCCQLVFPDPLVSIPLLGSVSFSLFLSWF